MQHGSPSDGSIVAMQRRLGEDQSDDHASIASQRCGGIAPAALTGVGCAVGPSATVTATATAHGGGWHGHGGYAWPRWHGHGGHWGSGLQHLRRPATATVMAAYGYYLRLPYGVLRLSLLRLRLSGRYGYYARPYYGGYYGSLSPP